MANPIAIRDAFGRVLARLGLSHSELVVVDAGSSEACRSAYFAREFPDRFVRVGPAELDLLDTAAGLSLCDKVVFACTDAIGACRAWESARNSLALDGLSVAIFGIHGGLSAGVEGAAQQGLEDLALYRAIPNMRVVVPCDAAQTEAVVEWLAEDDGGPTYVRLGHGSTPIFLPDQPVFQAGRARLLRPGCDVTLIACGSTVAPAMDAANRLADEGVDVRVLDFACIKPLDEAAVLAAARDTAGIVTVEEGNIVGGLGSAVCEVVSSLHPTRVRRLGVPDVFGRSGEPEELMKRFGLDEEGIVKATRMLLATRKQD